MNSVPFSQLQAFLTVARLRSFSVRKEAKDHGVTGRGAGESAGVLLYLHRRFVQHRPLTGPGARSGSDITDNMLGQRRVSKSQQRLPVQPGRVWLKDVPAAGRARQARSGSCMT